LKKARRTYKTAPNKSSKHFVHVERSRPQHQEAAGWSAESVNPPVCCSNFEMVLLVTAYFQKMERKQKKVIRKAKGVSVDFIDQATP